MSLKTRSETQKIVGEDEMLHFLKAWPCLFLHNAIHAGLMSLTFTTKTFLWQCKTSDSLAATGQQTRLEEKQSSVNGKTFCTTNQWVNNNTFKQNMITNASLHYEAKIMKLK